MGYYYESKEKIISDLHRKLKIVHVLRCVAEKLFTNHELLKAKREMVMNMTMATQTKLKAKRDTIQANYAQYLNLKDELMSAYRSSTLLTVFHNTMRKHLDTIRSELKKEYNEEDYTKSMQMLQMGIDSIKSI